MTPAWGNEAIHWSAATRWPGWIINPQIISDRRHYLNKHDTASRGPIRPCTRLAIRATVARSEDHGTKGPTRIAFQTDLLVDTGAMFSVFRSDVAERLLLPETAGRIVTPPVEMVRRTEHFQFCVHRVEVQLGGYLVPIDAHFPMILGYHCYDPSWPNENILGMNGVLSYCMLCFTPAQLYVCPRTQPCPTPCSAPLCSVP